jgi:hypothetical protein
MSYQWKACTVCGFFFDVPSGQDATEGINPCFHIGSRDLTPEENI